MKGLPARVAAYLLGVLAVIWPWGGFSYLLYVPGAGLDLIDLIVLALAVLTGLDLAFNRKLRLPFELTWPCLLLLALTIPSAVRRDTWTAGLAPVSVILFVSTVHFGPTPPRGQEMGPFFGRLRGLSGRVYAAFQVHGGLACQLSPFHGSSRALLSRSRMGRGDAGPLSRGSCCVWPRGATRRGLSGVAALAGALAVLVVLLSSGDAPAFQWQARLAGRSVAAWTIAATAWWLVARVAAKLEVDRREQGQRLASPPLGHDALGSVRPPSASPHNASAAGIPPGPGRAARGTAVPAERPCHPHCPRPGSPWPRSSLWSTAYGFCQGNIEHPYDYEELAARDYKAGHFGRIEERMAVFQGISPVETRTFLWRAPRGTG